MSLFDQQSDRSAAPHGLPHAVAGAPLAERMRPRTLDEYRGQEKLLGPGRPLRVQIENDNSGSMILWGPPGVGKTTLAKIIATLTQASFIEFSAVTSGIKEIKQVMATAEQAAQMGSRTILFVDEIHRFNKAQQDAFLPYVERGSIRLIGATTENPSFEIVSALLSRCRVYVLESLAQESIEQLLTDALNDAERGLGQLKLTIESEALQMLAAYSSGDCRAALNSLEVAAQLAVAKDQTGVHAHSDSTLDQSHEGYQDTASAVPQQPQTGEGALAPAPRCITVPIVKDALQRRVLRYDKQGEEHYDLISALHKSVRNSDPDAALYWLARMFAGGEDPMYLARRIVRMAAEDIGLAAPEALNLCLSAKQTMEFLGSPEGDLALAEAVVYLALAPKSNSVYTAWNQLRALVETSRQEPVPLHLRNAPTKLMEQLGYKKGYKYAHDEEGKAASMQCLPDGLADRSFYMPTQEGREKLLAQRLDEIRRIKERKRSE